MKPEPYKPMETPEMTTKSAALLTAVMLSAILFMGAGLFSVDAGGHTVSSDGYGVSTSSR